MNLTLQWISSITDHSKVETRVSHLVNKANPMRSIDPVNRNHTTDHQGRNGNECRSKGCFHPERRCVQQRGTHLFAGDDRESRL
jgi:hypothetical protein